MNHSRSVAVGVAAVALSITLVGCASKNEVAAPDGGTPPPPASPQTATTIVARSYVSQTGIANSFVASPPVATVLDQNGAPMPDVEVSFVVTNGEGSVAPDRVRTDLYGLARASWRLGSTTAENTLTATAPGIQPLIFRANSLVPQSAPAVRATKWDLLLIAGQQLPLTYSGGGSSWTITGGQYVFLDDSTYALGYAVDGVKQTYPVGRYLIAASGVVQFYDQRGILFSTATIQGNLVTVTYEDVVDFDPETYVMASH